MSNRGSKKGKSSEFNAQDDGHIKSGPAVKVWSQEGFILTSKNHQKLPNKAKKKLFHGTLKKIPQSNERVLGCKGHTWAETIEKSNKNYQVWSHEGSTF